MKQDIHHEADRQRFTISVDGHTCVLDYELSDSVMTITHTGVPAAVGGKGIAAALTQVALDTARERQWQVIPRCSYAAVYLERHPQYADLKR
jgi:predicted GNAT family acetyltransferase